MNRVEELLSEVRVLPVEDRLVLVDSLLESLHPANPDIDVAWAKVAERRLEELRSGKVEAIPGEQVVEEIKRRYFSR